MAKKRTNPDFMNGIPELLVLKLLAEEDMYGYQMMKTIRERSDERVSISEGCLYPLLKKLEKQGLISKYQEEVNGRDRYYYALEDEGAKQLEDETEKWKDAVEGVAAVMDEPDVGTAGT